MKSGIQSILACAGIAFAALAAPQSARAAVIPYANSGTVNPILTPTFTAIATGLVTATVATGTGASFDNQFGYSIGGGDPVFIGLFNKDPVGTNVSFGVTSGDILRLFIKVANTGDIFSSDKSKNSDGLNHIYTVDYAGSPNLGLSVPSGRYVSFEDLRDGGDLNYNDFNLVLTNISAGVPEPATWAMMLIGFAGLALAGSRRQRALAASV